MAYSREKVEDIYRALTTGKAQPARLYDFKNANKFFKEQIRSLRLVFENFSYLLAGRLTSQLHTACKTEVISVCEQSFLEFNQSPCAHGILGVTELAPLQGSALIALDAAFVYAVLSRMFGGLALREEQQKGFTEIELSQATGLLLQMMDLQKEAWARMIALKPRLTRVERSLQFAQIASANEPCAVVRIAVSIDSAVCEIAMCLPHFLLQPAAKQLSTANWTLEKNESRAKESSAAVMRERLEETELCVSAQFQEVKATFAEILKLKAGDVICLGHSTKSPLIIKIGGVPKYEAEIGAHGKSYAVRLVGKIREDKSDE